MNDDPGDLPERDTDRIGIARRHLDPSASQARPAARSREVQHATEGVGDGDPSRGHATPVLIRQAHRDMTATAASRVVLKWRRRLVLRQNAAGVVHGADGTILELVGQRDINPCLRRREPYARACHSLSRVAQTACLKRELDRLRLSDLGAPSQGRRFVLDDCHPTVGLVDLDRVAATSQAECRRVDVDRAQPSAARR